MISWMQSNRKYLIVTIWVSTIAFVGAGFVGWGMYDYNTDRATAMAKVGDIKVTGKEFQSAYSNIYAQYNEFLGGKLTQEKAKELKLDEITFEKLLQEALFLNYANTLGILALDSDIAERLHAINAFKKDGVFDKNQYFQTIKTIGLNAKEFEDSLRKKIILEKLTNILNLPSTDLEIQTLFASTFLADKLEIKTITVDESKLTIGDTELKSFWENNQNRYITQKSYILDIVEIPVQDTQVSEEELTEHYKDKKYLFKDDKDKILPFEDAKERVMLAVQFKKARKTALKKYLAFKNGEIQAQKTITITENNNSFPLDKLETIKKDDFIKPIQLESHYMVARLKEIKFPEPMQYQDAKELAKQDLLIEKRYDTLELQAKNELKEFSGKDIGFVSRDDVTKFTDLNQDEALQFLNNIFSTEEKKGFYVFKDKALLYKITDQRLHDSDKLEANKELILNNLESIKANSIENGLISKLEKEYKIERFYKGQ